MAGEARKLSKQLQVPPAYTKGVGARSRWVKGEDGKMRKTASRGASVAGVMSSADDILVRMESALDTWKTAKAKKQGVNAAIKPLDEMAELVRRAEIESKDDGGAVVANVASALMRLNPEDRMTVLRRAGRPALFEPLLEAELPEPDAGGLDRAAQTESDRKSLAQARVSGEQAETFSVDQLPLAQRPSSFFVEPDRTSKRGNPVRSSETYKGHKPKEGNAPLDVQARRGARGGSGGLTDEDIEDFGMTEAAPSTRGTAKKRLADDQITQAKAIQKRGMTPTLPRVVRSKKKDASFTEADGPAVLTKGTSQRKGGKWSGRSTALEIEDEVARRNRSQIEKVVSLLYEKTQPVRLDNERVIATGEAAADAGLSPVALDGTETIDLDEVFPWWRARFAQLDSRGRYQYPARMPTAEFITGMIQGLYGVADRDFLRRVTPLIQRSIDAAPDTPALRQKAMIADEKTGRLRPFDPKADAARAGEVQNVITSSAGKYSRKVFLLSPQMERAMKQGVGSRDLPYPVYGDRQVPRERVTKPARTFKEQYGSDAVAPKSQEAARERAKAMIEGGEQPKAASPKQTLDRIQKARERAKQLMQGGPGTTDTSSINTVPQHSPVHSLLA